MKNFVVICFLVAFTLISCNNAEVNPAPADTTQAPPDNTDSVPGVINPGAGDPEGVIITPVPNDRNVIVPDSAY